MTEPRPINSAQPTASANTLASDRRPLQDATIARFRQTLLHVDPSPGNADSRSAPDATRRDPNPPTHAGAERRDQKTAASADSERRNLNALASVDAERRDLNRLVPADFEGRDPSVATPAAFATVGSLYYSLPVAQTPAEPLVATDTADPTRLIEQATSVLLERASRSDVSRFIVSLDHAIVGGASAEFVRDGAFLHVRLLARNDAAYRSMWTHRAELEERLAASTGLVTRIEILEVYGDGR